MDNFSHLTNSQVIKLREDIIYTYGKYLRCINNTEKSKYSVRLQFLCLDLGVDFSHLIDKGIVKYQAEEEQEDIDEENTSLDLESNLTPIGQCHFCGENLKDKRKGSLFCNSKHRASYHNNQKKSVR
ncbi:hypothetical protein [Cellulophaga sp. BC115SP]|uniref:hypothetical protein n=1 Tax=Cellulophaga sp. BC115SP TaxID=2683263 RepID=UPI0014134407|nr:hypothetical protein [Cellulophaga sp. BC115SP]NBB30662.1 hypothetical protein [Cellulophaga sp. BC115SP]